MTAPQIHHAEPQFLWFADDGRIPNSPLPVLIYRGVLDDQVPDAERALERLFAANGWLGAWTDGIYPFHHFHSTTHEVLGVARGWASVALGGERGEVVRVVAGDVLVIPAGVGHKHESSGAGFLVVGAYPEGRAWDLCRGEPGERERVRANLARVPLPTTDPVHGHAGGLLTAWASTGPADRHR